MMTNMMPAVDATIIRENSAKRDIRIFIEYSPEIA